MVGKCNKGDKWTQCSGGCNRYSLGNCLQGPKCTRKQPVKIEIKCTGNTAKSIQTYKFIFHILQWNILSKLHIRNHSNIEKLMF